MSHTEFSLDRFENRNGVISWRVSGWLAGVRIRKNLKTREEAAAEKASLEIKAIQLASGIRLATTFLTDDQLAYAANDVAHLLALADPLCGGLHEAGLSAVADLEMSLIPVVVAMEANGIAVDVAELTRLRDTHRQQAHACAAQVRHLLGADARLNPGSPDQLKMAFAAAGVAIDSTAEAVLTTIDHPAAEAVLEPRRCEKVAQQAEALLEAVSRDGRIHAQFDPTGTETGRVSSKQPNLQNIGRGVMRSCFVAAPGHVLVGADYSQIELRVAAHLTPEPMMLAAYERGEDLHRQTAALVLHKPAEEVPKADRQLAKAVNFGLIYGQTANGLVEYARTAYNVTLTETEARIVSTVHDELIVETPLAQADEVKILLETAMVEAMQQNFPGLPSGGRSEDRPNLERAEMNQPMTTARISAELAAKISRVELRCVDYLRRYSMAEVGAHLRAIQAGWGLNGFGRPLRVAPATCP